MRQRIAKHEQALRNPNLGFLSAASARVRLFLTYIQYAFVHSFTLLFLHPTKSFVALNDPTSNGLWRRSYIEHLAYRNQVRFASLSGFFVLLTAAVATFAIVITVFPDRGVSPVLAATFTVNSNNDVDDGNCDLAHCSLREALVKANGNPGSDLITFSGAPYTIQPNSALPSLSDNGTTIQGGGKITVNGVTAGVNKHGFDVQADNVSIQGMIVHSFTGSAISIGMNADNAVIGGANASEGNILYSNGQNGIIISGGTGHKVSGNKVGQKVDGSLAKNTQAGVLIMGGNPSIGDTSSTNYLVDGITIGLNADGTTLYGNVVGVSSTGLAGAVAANAVNINGKNTTFGGTAAGQRNYVVGANSNGIDVSGSASNTSIIGNYVGLTPAGVVQGNKANGIRVSKATGGTTVSSNVIVSSSFNGIAFEEVTTGTNTIISNTVGVLPSGGAGGNGLAGILVKGSSSLSISGNISGYNSASGIELNGTIASVTGNYVGVDKSGNAITNTNEGVIISNSSAGTVIGGSEINRNYISGNGIGLLTVNTVTGNPTISYNYIGLAPDGASPVQGNGIGVQLSGQATLTKNVISGNGGGNVQLLGNDNTLSGNIIGLNSTGTSVVNGQSGYGVNVIAPSSNNTIGAQGDPNVVAGNSSGQINLDDGTSGNSVSYNYVNCNISCTALIDVDTEALRLFGSSSNTIQENYLGGGGEAIVYFDPGTTNATSNNTFIGNFVGVGTDGSDLSSDTTYGMTIVSSDTQTIGTPTAGNTFSHLTTAILVSASQGVSIRGNIFSDNGTNIVFENGANGSIEPPVITELKAEGASGTSAVSGTVDLYEDGKYVASGESDGTWKIVVALDTTKTITATITDSSGNTSDFGVYTPPEPEPEVDTTAPVSAASPSGGAYSGTQEVTLSATDDTDTAPQIFFTTDGSKPTTDSNLYTSAISIAADTTLKFFAIDSSDNAEKVNTEVYDIKQDKGGIISTENITVKADGETIHPECASCAIRIEDTTPTFLGIVSKSFIDYIVRLVIFASTQQEDGTTDLEKVFADTDTIVQNPKNTENAIWKITVPEDQALDLGEYVVKVGLRDPDGAVVKPMRKKVSLAVTPPNPVMVSPQALVYTKTPAFIGNAVNDARVIARVFQDGVEVGYCQADVINGEAGTGSYACTLPFELKAGQYTARVNTQDLASELISDGSEVVFSISRPVPSLENVPLSLVPSEVSIQSQYLTTDNTPVFVGLATNDTEVVLVIDGTKLFPATLTNDASGVGHWEATTSFLADGIHTAYAVVRSDGEEINRTATLQFKIVAPTVVPTISTPVEGDRFALGRQIIFTVLGHSGDTVQLSLVGSSTITVSSIFSADPSGTGSATFTFSNGLPQGTWVATAVATDSTGKPSLESEPVSISVFVPISTTPTTPTEPTEPTEPEEPTEPTEPTEPVEPTEPEEPTNTNEPPVNTNEEPVTNTNETPVNTNEVPTNTNEVPTGNVNETPTETPDDEREPLPEPPPAFTFPEAVENFPIIDKTPEDLTSEEVEAVRIVLNSYLESELQILPVEQEGNALYLVTETTVDNEPVLTVAQDVGLDSSSSINSVLNNVLRTFGFSQFKQTESLLIFRGTTVPYATVKLTIFSDPIVKIAQADADGRWTMTVAADTLPPGDHSAYVQTSYGDATSEEVQIARFVVVQQERLSNTTWLFIINLGVILIVLLAAIFLQLRKRTQLLEIKQGAIPAESPWKSGSVKMPKKEDITKKPKGPDDLGDIMGI